MKRFSFDGSHTQRRFAIPQGRAGEKYYGIGIASCPSPTAARATVGGDGPVFASTGAHGVILAAGVPVGPGAPLALEGLEQSISIELVSHMTGPVVVQVATCPAELELLRAPRAPYVAKDVPAGGVGGLPDLYEIAVPFHGRARFVGCVYLATGAIATGLTIRTIARWYSSGGLVRAQELNEYTAAADIPAAGTAKSYHETERCDEIAMQVEHSSGAEDMEFEAAAFDEGT